MNTGNPGRLPTLKDIARETGFSVTAVSHALKDLPDISPATRKVIKDCASRLGYIANASATSLRTGRTNTVAIILGDLSNPFFSFIAKELERLLESRGYSAFFMHSEEQLEIERRLITAACSRNVDGIIICPTQTPYSRENIDFIQNLHIPCVVIGRRFNDVSIDSVFSNDHRAGELAAEHVLSHGHRSILYIDTLIYNFSSIQRLAGFREKCAECEGVSLSTILFDSNGYFDKVADDIRSGVYSAVVAYNDIIAWDFMTRLRSTGKKVPDDLSMIAFDNLHSFLPLPFDLTSISFSKTAMTTNATELLMRRIADPDVPAKEIVLDANLFDRGSVRDI